MLWHEIIRKSTDPCLTRLRVYDTLCHFYFLLTNASPKFGSKYVQETCLPRQLSIYGINIPNPALTKLIRGGQAIWFTGHCPGGLMPNVGETAGGPAPHWMTLPIKGTTLGTILAYERAMCGGQATDGKPRWRWEAGIVSFSPCIQKSVLDSREVVKNYSSSWGYA